jgi:hypothetical protein
MNQCELILIITLLIIMVQINYLTKNTLSYVVIRFIYNNIFLSEQKLV